MPQWIDPGGAADGGPSRLPRKLVGVAAMLFARAAYLAAIIEAESLSHISLPILIRHGLTSGIL